ncbi:MAG: PadR family transcriptional regulator [Sandaracinus sp.]
MHPEFRSHHPFHHFFGRPRRPHGPPMGGPGFFGRHGDFERFVREPGPRAERGIVRYLVLDAIEKQPRHGYEIMTAITEKSGGHYKPSPGVIYPTLQMLEESGFAKGAETDGRRAYTITPEGKDDLAEHREDVDDFYARSGGGEDFESSREEFAELAMSVAKLFKKLRRAARHGGLRPSTLKALHKLLAETAGKVDELLGED